MLLPVLQTTAAKQIWQKDNNIHRDGAHWYFPWGNSRYIVPARLCPFNDGLPPRSFIYFANRLHKLKRSRIDYASLLEKGILSSVFMGSAEELACLS
jgi:hypothetical protein